jgi:F0F1-type ATP synthase alpha subunit
LGEVYRDSGYNSLLIYDSLTNHAISHRQVSLLTGRIPGREAYPADTFYLHAKLLERAAQLTKKLGYGSLTALPIVETLSNNLTSYIPTNIISITDGQIFLDKKLALQRIYPAIDLSKSVSRVGSKAQPVLLRRLSSLLKTMLDNYYFYNEQLHLGSVLNAQELVLYNQGCCAFNLCQQRKPYFFEEMVILIIAAHAGFLCPKNTKISIFRTLHKLKLPVNR